MLDEGKNDRVRQLQAEVDNLVEQLGQMKRTIEEKEVVIEAEVKAGQHLQKMLSMTEEANQKLAARIGYLSQI